MRVLEAFTIIYLAVAAICLFAAGYGVGHCYGWTAARNTDRRPAVTPSDAVPR